MFSKIRQRKKLLFALLGFISGAIGALIANIINNDPNALFVTIFYIALWGAIIAAIISLGLFGAILLYNRQKLELWSLIKNAVPSGLVAGALSGGIAQLIFGLTSFPDELIQRSFQACCWGIMGLILGWRLSNSIPNMDKKLGLIAGLIGGIIGGIGFLLSSMVLPILPGRMLGIGVLGAALGLCLIIVEERYRSAFLEVHWGPNESNEYTLGAIPIYVGGEGKNDIYVPKIPHHAVSISMENGIIKAVNTISGETKVMKEGSKIVMGNIEIIIRARQ